MNYDHLPLTALVDDCLCIDGHSHSDQYKGKDKELMIRDVNENRILTLSSATDPVSTRESFKLNSHCPWILTAAGIHPWKANLYGPRELEKLDTKYREAHQISEIGMDLFWAPPEASEKKQRVLLEAQLKLAVKYEKSVTLHTKGAEDQVIDLLKKVMPQAVLVHWFDGSPDQLRDLMDRGCFFTIPPAIITDPRCAQIIRNIPIERLLCETDNPPTWPWLFDQPPRAVQIHTVLHEASLILNMSAPELHEVFKVNLKTFIQF